MEALTRDLKGALAMIGQAQERCRPQSLLWKSLGEIFDEIDSISDALKSGEYREDISSE
jgi:hypothetical protein